MKLYYYLDENKLRGPLQVEEMRWKGLTKETLVWTEGMDDWKRAGDIAEIITISASAPADGKPAGIRVISFEKFAGIFLKIKMLPGIVKIAGILLKIKMLPVIIRKYILIPAANVSRVMRHSLNGVLFRLTRFYQFMVK